MTDLVVEFYGGGRDDRGRTLEQLWTWTDDRLEAVHDYIQWMFPTIQPSGVNPFAPLVTADSIRAFEERPELRDRLRRSLDRMLSFYGLRRLDTTGQARIEMDPQRFASRARTWLHPGNHNHLRLTRIMQSLEVLGLRPDAAALQRCLLEDVAAGPGRDRISSTTLAFWRHALEY